MDLSVVDWIRELGAVVASPMEESSGASALSSESRGELELWAGKVLLQRGALEQASDVLIQAGDHLTLPSRKSEVAGLLLSLAKAYTKRQSGSESAAHAERALREAARIAPSQGLPALAQYCQRNGRLSEALDHWREAVRQEPGAADNYLRLGSAYEQAGLPDDALAAYLEVIDVSASARNYLTVAQRLDDLAPQLPDPGPNRTIKVALLGSSTLDHLQRYFKVECYRAGLRPDFYQASFDQYTQEILNPQSGLYAFSPDVVILAIHASRLFPHLHHYPFDMTQEERRQELDAGVKSLQGLLDRFTESSSALVLLHNMVAPQHPALGIQDLRDDLGQGELFGLVNARLAEMARSRYKNVYIVDEDRIQARSGKARATDPRLWLAARMGWSDEVLSGLSKEYLRYVKPYRALSRKCIVVDLDNTLWGGVIGEDGLGGIQLGPDAPGSAFVAFQRELERLWRRGVLLAISSKNNEEDVLPVFEKHPHMVLRLSHFAAQRINWESKAANLRQLALDLNIGLDGFVFLDDNPVERARMRAELPQVLTVELPADPAYYRNALLELDVFDTLALTDEDRRRNELYAAQKARRELQAAHDTGSGSLEEYLADLGIEVEIDMVNEETLPRVAQLTNKTNQFNITTHRYSEADILAMQTRGTEVYSARVSDRFSDNGLVGVALLRPVPGNQKTLDIDTLLLSCRVMGRGVETAMLAFLVDRARERGVSHLSGWYLPSGKNAPAKDCYRQHGFTLMEENPDGSERWELHVEAAAVVPPQWLVVRTSSLAA